MARNGGIVCGEFLLSDIRRLAEDARCCVCRAERVSLSSAVDKARRELETLRLIARIGEMLAWGLGRLAVLHGEISQDQAAAFSLSQSAVCLHEWRAGGAAELPGGLGCLLDRSLALYRRIVALEGQQRAIAPNFGAADIALPARPRRQ